MRWWVGSSVAGRPTERPTPGEYVVETIRAFDWTGHAQAASDAVTLQTPSGDIGGMILAGVLLLALGLTGVAVWQGRLGSVATRVSGALGSGSGAGADEPAVETEAAQHSVEPEPEPEPEPTDQEVIVEILEGNEGRMKQAKIVDATGWSKSKVSMLLSEMEDDGHISKLRVGRENIISLQGSEPDAAGSPFEED